MGTNRKMARSRAAWRRITREPRRRSLSKLASRSQTRCHATRGSCGEFAGGGGAAGARPRSGRAARPSFVVLMDGAPVHKLRDESQRGARNASQASGCDRARQRFARVIWFPAAQKQQIQTWPM